MDNTLENKAKFCIRCGLEKALNEYYKHPRKDDLLSHCKSCHKKGVKKALENSPNKESIKIIKKTKSLERYHDKVKNNTPYTSVEDTNIWADIKGYENQYQVSKYGGVRRWNKFLNKWKEIKPYKDKIGYLKVTLSVDYKETKMLVHRLVALSFIANPSSKTEVNHIDGIKSNNDFNNLEWCTRSENMKHAHETGLRNGINKRSKNGTIAKGNRP